MIKNELLDLDFAPGLKAKDVNYNFDVVKGWIDRERLRIGGHGLVEGFNMTANLDNYTVTVSDGLMVNTKGEEVFVPGHTFKVGKPEFTEVTEPSVTDSETVIVPEDGILTLKYRPYSDSKVGFIEYIPPRDERPSEEEIHIEDIQTGMRVPILEIIGRSVMVNAAAWAGHSIRIHYYTTDSRIDSILIDMHGDYEYERSIRSTSPSHVDLGDFTDHYMIGVVYWDVSTKLDVQFYAVHRTYRKVYVDEQNRLWLNGELYHKSKFIYFEKPSDPQVNDLWYNSEDNILYIYREQNGEDGWAPINDCSSMTIREHKMFVPGTADWPADNQHFRFREDETNLWFVPNQHALEVRIDNNILMEDQYEEYAPKLEEDYLTNGRGFNLKDPLDRPTYVEVIINQIVRTRPVRELFQRAAIFVDEGHEYYNPLNKTKTFDTKAVYVIGEDQLEVYLDGKRLVKDIDFIELNENKEPATTNDEQHNSKSFRLKCDVGNAQLVAYKISKHVWNYNHLDKMVADMKASIRKNQEDIALLRTQLNQLNDNTTKQIQAMQNMLNAYKQEMGSPSSYMKADAVLKEAQIPESAKNRMVTGRLSKVIPTDNPVIDGLKVTDFITVSYVSEEAGVTPLIDTQDYTISATNTGIRIDLVDANQISVDANLYVQALMVGER